MFVFSDRRVEDRRHRLRKVRIKRLPTIFIFGEIHPAL